MHQASAPLLFRSRGLLFVFAALCALSLKTFAKDNPSTVSYYPPNQSVAGNMPFTSTYGFSITAPSTLTASTTCNLVVTAITVPDGVTDLLGNPVTAAIAAGFVKITTTAGIPVTQVTFSGASAPISLNVVVTFPTLNIGTVQSASFAYKIVAIPVTGDNTWPVGLNSQPTNDGSFINATAAIPPPPSTGGPTPVVNITSPDDSVSVPNISVTGFPATVPLTFTANVASTDTTYAIASVDASAAGTTVTVDSTSGLGTMNVTATGTITVSSAGTYLVQANARNSSGTGSDTAQFKVTITGANPPTVAITTTPPGGSPVPLNGQVFSFSAPQTGININVGFNAAVATGSGATFSSITTTLDNAPFTGFNDIALNSPITSGATALVYFGSSQHTLTVTAIDTNGLTATATATYTIVYTAPTPQISITQLGSGTGVTTAYTIPTGSSTIDIPFTFYTTTSSGFTISSITGSAGALNVSITGNTPGLPSGGPVTTTGKLLGVGPGNYLLTATGTSAGISATASVSFSVAAPLPLPTVTITPPLATSYTILSPATTMNIPLTFVGTSNVTGGLITKLTASLDGVALGVTPTNPNLHVATGTATLTVGAGSHVVVVTATDSVGTGSASATFTVTVTVGATASGIVFFDADFNGVKGASEVNLAGLTVKLLNSANAVVGTQTTTTFGYSFPGLGAGTYTASLVVPKGFGATTPSDVTFTVTGANVTVAPIGLGLKFSDIKTLSAGGFTIGYWKNNLDKTISGKTGGIQVPVASLNAYTAAITAASPQLALSDYTGLSAKALSGIMGATSSAPGDLLSKQLVASEYNYENGAYIGGSELLTRCFISWGEYVHLNPSLYTSTYTLWAKDWFDAYNNSHGGLVAGPNP